MSDPMGIAPGHIIITLPNKNGEVRYNKPMTLREFLDRIAIAVDKPQSMQLVCEDFDGEQFNIEDVRIEGDTIILVGE